MANSSSKIIAIFKNWAGSAPFRIRKLYISSTIYISIYIKKNVCLFVCLFVRYLLSPCNSYRHQIFCGTSLDLEEGREGVGGVGGGLRVGAGWNFTQSSIYIKKNVCLSATRSILIIASLPKLFMAFP